MYINEYSIKTPDYKKNGFHLIMNKFKNDTIALYVREIPKDAGTDAFEKALSDMMGYISSYDKPSAIFIKTDVSSKIWKEYEERGLLTKLNNNKADFILSEPKDLHLALEAIDAKEDEIVLPKGISWGEIEGRMKTFASDKINPNGSISFKYKKFENQYYIKVYIDNKEAMELTMVENRFDVVKNLIFIDELHTSLKNTKIVPKVLNIILSKVGFFSIPKKSYTETLKNYITADIDESDKDFIVFHKK